MTGEVREAVLSAAHDCFVEHGYRAVTMEQIARRAGYSKGAIYSNFESKSDLFLSMYASVAVEAATAIFHGLDDVDDLGELLDLGARGIVGLLRVPISGVLVAEIESEADRDPEIAARLARARADVAATVVRQMDSVLARVGIEPVVPTRDVAVVLDALVVGLALESVASDDDVVEVETVKVVLTSVLSPADC